MATENGGGKGKGKGMGMGMGKGRVKVRYGECLRNYGISKQAFTFDGCGEFTPKGPYGTPEAMICAACSCFRNSHRREEVQSPPPIPTRSRKKPTTATPPPPLPTPKAKVKAEEEVMREKKKAKKITRYTEAQRWRMREFAEKLGWKVVRHDEEEIAKLCEEIGSTPAAFKAWINNNRRRAWELAESTSASASAPKP